MKKTVRGLVSYIISLISDEILSICNRRLSRHNILAFYKLNRQKPEKNNYIVSTLKFLGEKLICACGLFSLAETSDKNMQKDFSSIEPNFFTRMRQKKKQIKFAFSYIV